MASRLKPPVGRRVDPKHRFSRGLIAAWLHNEGGGLRLNDTSLHGGHPATLASAGGWTTGPYGPTHDYASVLDANAGDISSTLFGADFAVGVRFMAPTIGTSFLFGKETSASSGFAAFTRAGNNRLEVRGPSLALVTPDSTIVAGQWHTALMTRTGTSMRVYLDGVERASTTWSGDGSRSAAFKIGATSFTALLAWAGSIDFVLAWEDRGFAAAEAMEWCRDPLALYGRDRLFILPTGIEPAATSSNQTITLDQATETGTANDIGTGTQTIPLDQATETGTPADLTPTPGVVAVTLDQATETGAAADLTAAPGVAAVVLDQATEAGTPDDVTPVAGAAAIPLDQATETGTAADITPDATAVVTLDQATEAGTPADLTPVPGVVAVTLDQATESGTASDLAALLPGQIPLDQAAETGTANDITPVPGAVAITLDQATETGAAADVTPAPGAVVATLDQAAETGAPADLTAVPGAAAVTLDQAAETGTAADITPVQAGAQVIVLDQATETGSAAEIAPTQPSALTGISTGDEVMRRRGPHWSGQMYADEVYEELEKPRPRTEEGEKTPTLKAAPAGKKTPPAAKGAPPAPAAKVGAITGGLLEADAAQDDEALSADDALMLMLLAA